MSERIIDARIKIRHIACFLEVARLRSVIGAAEALNISQPAATKTIQELEEILGDALFDRSHRRLALTSFGEVFYRYAATSLAALRQGIDAAKGKEGKTNLRVGALPSVSARILPEAVRSFTETEPGVNTRVITAPNDHLLALLRTGDVDLVIGRMADPSAMLGLSFEHLYSECAMVVARPDHPLVEVKNLTLRALTDYQVLLPPPDAVLYPLVQRLLLAHGVTNHGRIIETVSDAFARTYVRNSDALWVISEGVVANELVDGRLVSLPIDLSETVGPLGFTTRTDLTPSMAMTGLMALVRERASRIGTH